MSFFIIVLLNQKINISFLTNLLKYLFLNENLCVEIKLYPFC